MAPTFKYSEYNDNVEQATRWWDDYPIGKYTDYARPEATFNGYIRDVWMRPKSLMRSASYTNLTYIPECQHELPIKRSPSISSLAPSLGLLPYYSRVPERIVDRQMVYTPDYDKWYPSAYSRSRFEDTHRAVQRPLKKIHPSIEYYSSHLPYYTFQTRRVFFDKAHQPSYMRGSQHYMDKYVSARLKADDFAQRFVHTAYEWHRPHDYHFNRHLMLGSKVNVPVAPGNPAFYNQSRALRRLYRMTEKFYF